MKTLILLSLLIVSCQQVSTEDIIFQNMVNAETTKEQQECKHSEGFVLTYYYIKEGVNVYTCPICDKAIVSPLDRSDSRKTIIFK